MRCIICHRFVSTLSDSKPITELEVLTDSGKSAHVVGRVEIRNQCANCNEDIQGHMFKVDKTVAIQHAPTCRVLEPHFKLSASYQRSNDMRPKKAKVQAKFYVIDMVFTVECEECGGKGDDAWRGEIQSKFMEPA